MKSELSDIEGLGFRLEERQQDILQLKKTLKMKVSRNAVVVIDGAIVLYVTPSLFVFFVRLRSLVRQM